MTVVQVIRIRVPRLIVSGLGQRVRRFGGRVLILHSLDAQSVRLELIQEWFQLTPTGGDYTRALDRLDGNGHAVVVKASIGGVCDIVDQHKLGN